jgi:heme oxygenase (mycobilin-producing)
MENVANVSDNLDDYSFFASANHGIENSRTSPRRVLPGTSALTKAGATMSSLEVTLTLTEEPPPASHCPFHEAVGAIGSALVSGPPALAKIASPFVSLSKFVVANDKMAEVKEAFRRRPHLVDEQPGFVQMEVFSPLDRPEEIWLVTYWTDAESFNLWHHSHLYQQSHKGIPKGLKLVAGETAIRHFEHICS